MTIKPALLPYIPMADMLVRTFGKDCEVVLHDLDHPEHSVVYVANPTVTDRKIGESFDQLIRQVILSDRLQENYAANYYFTAPNGKRIRSSTLLIKSEDGHLEGALCINLDTSKIYEQIALLETFLPDAEQTLTPAAVETDPASEHVAVMIENLMDGIIGTADTGALTREDRIRKVKFMEEKGIFLMKGSVERAAAKLGVNKVTIYSYLDEIRGKR